jgi:hypothetical protein
VTSRSLIRRQGRLAVAAALSIVATGVVSAVAGISAASATPGGYDPNFGRGGVVQTSNAVSATGVVVDPSTGDIVTSAQSSIFRVDRFTTSGGFVSAGGTFGGEALAVTTVPPGHPGAGYTVAAGFITDASCSPEKRPVVAEFTRAGTLVLESALPASVCGQFDGVTIDGSGNIVATGYSGTPSEMVIARFGTPGFGHTGAGYTVVAPGAGWQASAGNAVAITGTGSTADIVVAGSATPRGTGALPQFAVAEFDSTGALVPGYGTAGLGITLTGQNGQANGLTVMPGGYVWAGGLANIDHFLLWQFNSKGVVTRGAVGPGLTTPTGWSSVAYQPFGNLIVAAGYFGTGGMAVSQFNASSGAINLAFGSSGTALRSYPVPNAARSGGVAVQRDGKTVVAGGAPVPGGGAEAALTVFRLLGPTASVFAPGPTRVTKNGLIRLVFRVSIDEPLPGNVYPVVCGPPGSLVNGARTCAELVIGAGQTAVGVAVEVTIDTPVGTNTDIPLTFVSGNGLTPSARARTAIAVVEHFPPPPTFVGYWLVATDGGIFNFGTTHFYGSTGNVALNKPIVGMSVTPDGHGYWLVASDGGIFTFGDAKFYGSTGAVHLNKPIVGMAATPDGHGYWLVATDGGIFTFGDARFFGSTGNVVLDKPIVGMAPTPDGKGYWLVASDGGIFTFGDARFFGSTGNVRLNKPIVGMAAYPGGGGYWLVATDGGIFSFGSAGFHGSTGAVRLNKPIVAMAATYNGGGYWLVASDGGIFSFGDAGFFGSTGNVVLNKPIVGMAG